jgi:hypothetical protein
MHYYEIHWNVFIRICKEVFNAGMKRFVGCTDPKRYSDECYRGSNTIQTVKFSSGKLEACHLFHSIIMLVVCPQEVQSIQRKSQLTYTSVVGGEKFTGNFLKQNIIA